MTHKKNIIFIIITSLSLLMLINTRNAHSHGSGVNSYQYINKETRTKSIVNVSAAPKASKQDAFNDLSESIKFMKSIVDISDIKEINNDISIIMSLHESTKKIEKSLNSLDYHINKMDDLSQDNILKILSDLSQSMLIYKISISQNNIEKSRAELVRATEALQLLAKKIR